METGKFYRTMAGAPYGTVLYCSTCVEGFTVVAGKDIAAILPVCVCVWFIYYIF